MPPRTSKDKALNFEQSMARLEQIAALLEHPETGLEQTISLVEEGRSLVSSCRKLLDEAELKIKQLEAPEPVAAPPADKKGDENGFSLI